MATITDTYPIFENGQALTSTHLNDMFDYLEEQERLTRIKLIGSGIVCGLDIRLVRNPATAVVISQGTGLTSWGFLLNFPLADINANVASEVSFPYFTVYTDPNEEIYPRFLKNEVQIPLYELQAIKIKDADPLDELPLPITDYGVILYMECLDKKLKNCIQNDCDDKGIERIFTLRKLLVPKENLRDIICAETNQNVPKTEADLENLIHARFQGQGINVPRILFNNLEITSSNQLQQVYLRLIDKTLPDIAAALHKDFINFASILNRSNKQQNETILLSDLRKIRAAAKDICLTQYVYDFFYDLAVTHNEFIAAAFDLMTDCCPDINRFPKHLRLGHLTEDNNCKPSVYRHGFSYSPILNQQSRLKDKVRRLYDKLMLMINNFQDTSAIRGIRITPSTVLHKPLSEQAIPFYYKYDSSLLKNWNPELGRRCREKENLSYYANKYAVLDHVTNPLNYSILPYDFFRVEGHLCQDYRVVLRQILNLRKAKNLAFDVITLKIGTNGADTSVDLADCKFKDLEVICEAWKKELECLLSDSVRQITNINVADTFVDAGSITLPPPLVLSPLGSTNPLRTPLITERILENVNIEAGFLGSYLVNTFQAKEPDNCINKDFFLDKVRADFPLVAAMPQEEFEGTFKAIADLSTGMLTFATIVDDNCDSLDIKAIEREQRKLLTSAKKYNTIFRRGKLDTNKYKFDFNSLARITSTLISVCTVEQLKVLKAEIERRKAEIQKLNLFHEYAKKNPGLDHRGGVPKGGTLVLAYAGASEITSNGTNASSGSVIDENIISGRVVDVDGNSVIGATVLVRGTARGTITNFDGDFSLEIDGLPLPVVLETVFVGFNIIENSFSEGRENVVIVMGDSVVIEENPLSNKVVADFYLPYLCCSDCPPVTYVFEDKAPPVVVDLTIDGEVNFYCTDDDRAYEFKVTPPDGKVEGEGVTKSGDKYVFTPARVDLNGDDQKNINFRVNGEAVALSIKVIQKPTVDFDCKIEWIFDASGKRIPVLILENKEYNELYLYSWQIKEKPLLNGAIDTANPITIPLQGEKTGNPISITVSAQYPDVCQTSKEERKEVPEDGLLVDINFTVIGNESEISPSAKNVYTINNRSINLLRIIATPKGIFEVDATYEFLQVQIQTNGIPDNSSAIVFKTQDKEGTHQLKYKVEAQAEEITLIIRNNDGQIVRPILSFAENNFNSLNSLASDARFRELIGRDNEALKITTDLSKQLLIQIKDDQKFTALKEGQQDEKINEKVTQASDLVIKLIKSEGTTLNAKVKKELLFSMYKEQVVIALIVITIIKADLNPRHVLSKLITKFIKQIKDLKKAKVNIDSLIEFVEAAQNNLVNKPKTKERFTSIIKAIKEAE